ncbi:hypothetical protein ABEB36_004350, partial [Hypothenemus hampei]
FPLTMEHRNFYAHGILIGLGPFKCSLAAFFNGGIEFSMGKDIPAAYDISCCNLARDWQRTDDDEIYYVSIMAEK